MKRRGTRRRLLVALAGLTALLALACAGWYVRGLLRIGAAYKAKVLCSAVFVSGRAPEQVLREDLDRVPRFLRAELDRGRRSVTVRFPGLPPATAVYREGLGCTLLAGTAESELRAQARGAPVPSAGSPRLGAGPPARRGGRAACEPGFEPLCAVVEGAFAEPDPKRPRRSRALVVLWKGRIVSERYG